MPIRNSDTAQASSATLDAILDNDIDLSYQRRKTMITTLINHGDYRQGELHQLYLFLFAISPSVDMDLRAIRSAIVKRIASPLYDSTAGEIK